MTIIKHPFRLLFFLVFTSFCSYGQSVHIMPFLPKAKGVEPAFTAPAGTIKETSVMDMPDMMGFRTDTLHIHELDSQGRTIKSISFSSKKRMNPYYYEFPDSIRTRSYSYSYSVRVKGDTILNVNDGEWDSNGRKVYWVSFQVSSKGDTTIINSHKQNYDDKGRLVYRCDLCNVPHKYNNYFTWQDSLLVYLLESRRDSVNNIYHNYMSYDAEGRMTKYKRIYFSANTEKIMDEYDYEYSNGLLSKESLFFEFEPNTKRVTRYEYNKNDLLIKTVASIENDSIVTDYIYKGDNIMRMDISSTFPVLTTDQFYFSARALTKDEPQIHKMRKDFLYDKRGNCYGSESTRNGKVVIRRRMVWE